MKPENHMRQIFIEKMVLGISSQPDKLDKGAKLLKIISGSKPAKRTSTKRIPSLGVRPGLEIGVMVTIREPERIDGLLRRFLASIENTLKENQISTNTFSFGIEEYIEVEGIEYQRDIGIIGFDVTLSFARKGKRVARKKIRRGRLPVKQHISKDEIIEFMKKNYKVIFKTKERAEEAE